MRLARRDPGDPVLGLQRDATSQRDEGSGSDSWIGRRLRVLAAAARSFAHRNQIGPIDSRRRMQKIVEPTDRERIARFERPVLDSGSGRQREAQQYQ